MLASYLSRVLSWVIFPLNKDRADTRVSRGGYQNQPTRVRES